MLLRLLVLVVRDSVITLSAIAYNVNNNLDEVLLAIVCTVYSGNIITRSRLFLKVAVTRAFVALGSSAQGWIQTSATSFQKLVRIVKKFKKKPESHARKSQRLDANSS